MVAADDRLQEAVRFSGPQVRLVAGEQLADRRRIADRRQGVQPTIAADLVIGSRYVAGGGTENWGVGRRAISRWGSAYARALLGVEVRDMTGGFKVFRREVLEAIGLDSIPVQGYAFQVETTYRAIRAGFRVTEVPIVFSDRRVGESKMSSRIVLEAALRVPAMRLRGR